MFALAPLDSRLFDETTMPLLANVRFPNHVWQRIIRLMSLTRGKKGGQGRGQRRGRVSYQLLSINQLGAVYEALLSYRGFFAAEDLYEVQPAPKKAGRSAADEDDEGGSDAGDANADGDDAEDGSQNNSGSLPSHNGSCADLLENAWFVPASRLGDYKEDERVYDVNEAGHRQLRKHPRAASSTAWPGATGKRAPATTRRRCSPVPGQVRAQGAAGQRPRQDAPTTSSRSPCASPPWAARRF